MSMSVGQVQCLVCRNRMRIENTKLGFDGATVFTFECEGCGRIRVIEMKAAAAIPSQAA